MMRQPSWKQLCYQLSSISTPLLRDASRHVPPPEILQSLYALTPAEARLSVALATRGTLARAAEANGITLGTARQYLKRVFGKVAVETQAALIARVTSLG